LNWILRSRARSRYWDSVSAPAAGARVFSIFSSAALRNPSFSRFVCHEHREQRDCGTLCNFDNFSCFWISSGDWNFRLHRRQHICVVSANSESSMGAPSVVVAVCWPRSSSRLLAHFSIWAVGFLMLGGSTLRFFFCCCWSDVGSSRFVDASGAASGTETRTGS